MNEPINVVKKFSQRKDVVKQYREILTTIIHNPIRKNIPCLVDEVNTIHAKHLTDRLTPLTGLPQQIKVQTSIYNATMYHKLTALAATESEYLTNCVEQFEQLEDMIHQARIAMELNYQISNVQALPASLLGKLCVTDTPTSNIVTQRLLILQRALNQMLDIKAIIAEPVLENDDLGVTLQQVITDLDLNPSLQLSCRVLTDPNNQYLDAAINRPTYRYMSAAEAGYDNVTCANVFSSLCKLASQASKTYRTWFVDRPRYVNKESRIVQAVNSLPVSMFESDLVDVHTATMSRFKRITVATNLLTQVIYPTLAVEIDAFNKLCGELGAHKVLDDSAHLATPEVTEYPLYKEVGEKQTFLEFLQKKQGAAIPQYIPAAFKYCVDEIDALLGRMPSLSADTPISLDAEILPYNIEHSLEYMKNWEALNSGINGELLKILQSDRPANSWSSLDLDIENFLKFGEFQVQTLSFNQVEARQDSRDLLFPIRYKSPYRINKNQHHRATARELGYTDPDKVSMLTTSINAVRDSFGTLRESLNALHSLTNSFPSEYSSADRVKFHYLYKSVADILQNIVFYEADFKAIETVYKR